MSFLSLLTVLAVGVLIASLITNFLKGMVLVISALGICFYLFFATVEQKSMLDAYAKQVDFGSVSNLETSTYAQKIDSLIKEGTAILDSKTTEIKKQIDSATAN